MPGFDSYTQLRQAEDVQDDIYMISPVDNPVASMSRTTAATGKYHEWTEDELAATKKNAAVEGATAGADNSAPVVERGNYCQIMTEVAEITGTLEVVDKYGRDSEMAYQLEKRYASLAKDEEGAIAGDAGGTGRQVAVAGNGATAREMAGVYAQIDAATTRYATDDGLVGGVAITTTAELEAALIATHLLCYNEGGNPQYAITDPLTAGYFAGFARSAGRSREIMESTLVNVIDLYVSTYGQLNVVLDREMAQTNNAILLADFNYAETPVLRPTRDTPLAKTGDSDRRFILRESTFALLNSKAWGLLDNVPTNLT